MPNIHLTRPMQDYVDVQIKSGSYANMSEVVRAGLRLLMEKDGARQFYLLKADLDAALDAVDAGDFVEIDPKTYEPDAFRA